MGSTIVGGKVGKNIEVYKCIGMVEKGSFAEVDGVAWVKVEVAGLVGGRGAGENGNGEVMVAG